MEEICTEVKNVEPWLSGQRIPSTAFCLLYKLFTLRLTVNQMSGILNHKTSIYARCLGFLYLRYICQPDQLWDWFEPYLLSEENLVFRCKSIPLGKYVQDLLIELRYCETLFPRIPTKVAREIEQKIKDYVISEKKTPVTEVVKEEKKTFDKNYRNEERSKIRERRERRRSRSHSRDRYQNSRSRERHQYESSPQRRKIRGRSRSKERERSPSRSRDKKTKEYSRSRSSSRSPESTKKKIESETKEISDSKQTVKNSSGISLQSLKALYGVTSTTSTYSKSNRQDLSCASETIILGKKK